MPYQPRFSVIVVGDETEARYLKNTLNSLLDQTYNKWDACLVSTSEKDLVFDTTVADIIQTDERIHHHQWKTHDSSNPIMQALSTAQGEFIVKLNAGDKLSPDAIFEVAKALNSTHHIDII
ncbi:MAG: glycosyltransferase, partial [Anaerolineales bacterium]|nr:glycosyltransferase [Anaerolineales bacterium]